MRKKELLELQKGKQVVLKTDFYEILQKMQNTNNSNFTRF